jgi:hypothetical protein
LPSAIVAAIGGVAIGLKDSAGQTTPAAIALTLLRLA